jgi:hypothetical protein
MTFKNKAKSFLYGLTTSGIRINIVGNLVIAEIISLIILPFLVKKFFLEFSYYRLLFYCYLIFLFSLMFSDLLNETLAENYLRGWAIILFSFASTSYILSLLKNDIKSVFYILFGMVIVNIFYREVDLSLMGLSRKSNYFKSTIVPVLNYVIMILALFFSNKRNKKNVFLLFLFYFLTCFILGARSNGLVFLISLIIYGKSYFNIKLKRIDAILFSFILLALLQLLYIYYVNQVLYNNFGGINDLNQLSKMSNPYNPFELLFIGRFESFAPFYAIADKPFFGFGSWAIDYNGEYSKLFSYITGGEFHSTHNYIVGHSILAVSWLWGGFVGFISILILFFKFFNVSIKFIKLESNNFLLPLVIWSLVNMIWGFLFSPFGLLRTVFPFFAAITIYIKKEYKL